MPGWVWRPAALEPVPDDLAKRLARFPAAALLARLLVARGVGEPHAARRFLHPSLARDLGSPAGLVGLDEAVGRLLEAHRRGGTVVALVERTAGGLLSGAVLADGMARLGLQTVVRLDGEPGTGLSLAAGNGGWVRCGRWPGVAGGAPDLLVCAGPQPSGLADIALAGLVLYLLVTLRARRRAEGRPAVDLRPVLDLVAVGTLVEGVPLRGENRLLARRGLERLRDAERPGLEAMLDAAMVRPVTAARLSARLRPRLEAAVRSPDPGWVLDLLTTTDAAEGARLATELEILAARSAPTGRAEARDEEEPIEVDAELSLAALTPGVASMLELLEPYGPGNPEPVLLARQARLEGIRLLGGPERPHCVLRLRQDGRTVRASGAGGVGARAVPGGAYDVVYRARRGQGRLEVEVIALDPPLAGRATQGGEMIRNSVVS